MKNYKPFSVYRPNDYRTPRSMKQAFGDDQRLYVEEREDISLFLAAACALLALAATVVIVAVL